MRLGLLGVLVAIAYAVEVGLIFPRNETYSPADWLPIVFAVQSPQDAELLNLRISYSLRHGNDANNSTTPLTHDLRWANLSSSADPNVACHYLPMINNTGYWSVDWWLRWESCDEEATAKDDGHEGVLQHYYSWAQSFTTSARSISAGRDSCVVTANSTTTPDPCRIAIDKDTAAGMAAVQHQRLCDGLNAPDDCFKGADGAPQRSAVMGGSCLLAALGVIGFALL